MTLIRTRPDEARKTVIATVMAEWSDYDTPDRKLYFKDNPQSNKHMVSRQFGWAVRQAGGTPRWIGYDDYDEAIECDGLLLTGADTGLPKEWYIGGEHSPHPATGRIDFERRLIDAFVKAGKPIFGICHGLQHIGCHFGSKMTSNIHEYNARSGGGILHRQPDSPAPKLEHHNVSLLPGTLVGTILGANSNPDMVVNSHHFEAIVKPSSDVRVSAHAPDGTIEIIEVPLSLSRGRQSFVVGVQSHQEFELPDHRGHALFKAFVDRARDPELVLEPAA